MDWKPISLSELESMVFGDLEDCSDQQRDFFTRVRITPHKWHLSPWGDEGGGFWAVAVYETRVLWFNDIEDGFNVSTFEVRGEIPEGEYGCNEDPLRVALLLLEGKTGQRRGSAKSHPETYCP